MKFDVFLVVLKVSFGAFYQIRGVVKIHFIRFVAWNGEKERG